MHRANQPEGRRFKSYRDNTGIGALLERSRGGSLAEVSGQEIVQAVDIASATYQEALVVAA